MIIYRRLLVDDKQIIITNVIHHLLRRELRENEKEGNIRILLDSKDRSPPDYKEEAIGLMLCNLRLVGYQELRSYNWSPNLKISIDPGGSPVVI